MVAAKCSCQNLFLDKNKKKNKKYISNVLFKNAYWRVKYPTTIHWIWFTVLDVFIQKIHKLYPSNRLLPPIIKLRNTQKFPHIRKLFMQCSVCHLIHSFWDLFNLLLLFMLYIHQCRVYWLKRLLTDWQYLCDRQ